MLHTITKPRPWRGGAHVSEDVFEDAQTLKRVEVEEARVEGTLAGRYARTSDRPQALDNRALQDLEEALLPMKAEELKRAASSDKATEGVGADGFLPKVPLDFNTAKRVGKFWYSWSPGQHASLLSYFEECHQ